MKVDSTVHGYYSTVLFKFGFCNFFFLFRSKHLERSVFTSLNCKLDIDMKAIYNFETGNDDHMICCRIPDSRDPLLSDSNDIMDGLSLLSKVAHL